MSSAGSILRWTALALAGLAIAAGVAFAASHLVSQRIGLASQPLNAGRELAPQTARPRARPGDPREAPRRGAPIRSTTAPAPAPPVTTVPPAPPAAATTVLPAPPATSTSAPDGEGSGPDD